MLGIIGSGLGGSVTAYRLKRMFGADLPTIDVYEGHEVGGRLRTIPIDGAEYEVGGTIIHPANQYMVEFAAMLGV